MRVICLFKQIGTTQFPAPIAGYGGRERLEDLCECKLELGIFVKHLKTNAGRVGIRYSVFGHSTPEAQSSRESPVNQSAPIRAGGPGEGQLRRPGGHNTGGQTAEGRGANESLRGGVWKKMEHGKSSDSRRGEGQRPRGAVTEGCKYAEGSNLPPPH